MYFSRLQFVKRCSLCRPNSASRYEGGKKGRKIEKSGTTNSSPSLQPRLNRRSRCTHPEPPFVQREFDLQRAALQYTCIIHIQFPNPELETKLRRGYALLWSFSIFLPSSHPRHSFSRSFDATKSDSRMPRSLCILFAKRRQHQFDD